ncbi:hypothetical protein RGQ13_08705 [Thalassotalea psychrophila]|uniref:Uncharacterized protein n=1 Tax=Thalassotalea psychrophila TaxID=3065647 RepID=A0ABY9U4Z1_9GAMM|nr:hypothetical protein RGQ13_08705 [Colwelliaceae bacterium SQ149]
MNTLFDVLTNPESSFELGSLNPEITDGASNFNSAVSGSPHTPSSAQMYDPAKLAGVVETKPSPKGYVPYKEGLQEQVPSSSVILDNLEVNTVDQIEKPDTGNEKDDTQNFRKKIEAFTKTQQQRMNGGYDFPEYDEGDSWKAGGSAMLIPLFGLAISALTGNEDLALNMGLGVLDAATEGFIDHEGMLERSKERQKWLDLGYLPEYVDRYEQTGDMDALISSKVDNPNQGKERSRIHTFKKGEDMGIKDAEGNPIFAEKTGQYEFVQGADQRNDYRTTDVVFQGDKDAQWKYKEAGAMRKTRAKQLEEQQAEQEATDGQVSQLDELIDAGKQALVSGNIDGNTGPMDAWLPDLTDDAQKTTGDFERFKELLTVENLDKMSGVLTDKDIQVLRSAASALDTGRYWTVNKAEVQRVLGNLQTKRKGLRSNSGSGKAPMSALQYLYSNPNALGSFESKYGYKPEGF